MNKNLINISDKLLLELSFLGLSKIELGNLEETDINYRNSSIRLSENKS